MTDEKYIRKAVELADGWSLRKDTLTTPTGYFGRPEDQETRDALAAQLVRQIESPKYIAEFYLDMARGHVAVRRIVDIDEAIDVSACYAEGRTMNTIKAIVDSGVLEND